MHSPRYDIGLVERDVRDLATCSHWPQLPQREMPSVRKSECAAPTISIAIDRDRHQAKATEAAVRLL
jgi:hypothetical protein